MAETGTATFTFRTLNRSDLLDLERFASSEFGLPEGTIRLEEEPLPDGRFGEPVTLLVVASLTAGAIGALAAWLVKTRQKVAINYSAEATYADGAHKRVNFQLSQSSSESPSKEVLEQLSGITGLPVAEILKATSDHTA